MKRPSIENILRELQSGKAVGPDGMPNELLRYGGDILLSSLAVLFIAVTDLATIPLNYSRSVHDIDNYRGLLLLQICIKYIQRF